MKTITSLLLAAQIAITASALAGSGPGPWSDGAYYPGALNGKYMGIVTGNNIAGVLGFAIVDGAPPYREIGNPYPVADATTVKQYEYDNPRIDVLQNYFAIFVEGRTYTGLTTAGININDMTVAGALQGTDPIGVPAAVTGAPGPGDFNFDATDALSIINRGLSGGFTAKIKSKQAVFTFKGDGQLSTPANRQSYQIETLVTPSDQRTNEIVTGIYKTDSTCFNVSGIRTSLFANNPAAQLDQLTLSGGGGAGGGGGGGQ
jgi:hypothetical protein